jgi:uncharacterized OsmC-like protein
MQQDFSVGLVWRGDYGFTVAFEGDDVPALQTDEPPPLGRGDGPGPSALLAAAVGNCMSASLKFCLDRSRVNLLDLRARVDGRIERNDAGRFRVTSLRVLLEPVVEPGDLDRITRCLDMFEDFCIVGQSVRQGIAMEVEVKPGVATPAPSAPGYT